MKEVKFYCDFCGNEFESALAEGNFRDDIRGYNKIRVEVTTHYGGNQKHTCVFCLVLLIQKKETENMIRKVQNKNPFPMERKRKSAIDNGEDDL